MKILFVCSGNSSHFQVVPFIKIQADSLIELDIEVEFFTIKGKGVWGYLKNVRILKEFIKTNKHDLIHAHYSLSGIVAYLASKKPILTSLMGSDVNRSRIELFIIRFFVRHLWVMTIVKSEDMRKKLNSKGNVQVVPNGVDVDSFIELDKLVCRSKLGLDEKKYYVLFGADPKRREKNFDLAKLAVNKISEYDINILTLNGIPHDLVPLYINAADLLILTSVYEGSPNIVKEAMACNCPIVSTDVGDVSWLLSGIEGCYICKADDKDLALSLKDCLHRNSHTNGRKKLIELGLDSKTVAIKVSDIYKAILTK
jgi:glycosyltransferase involved in cell wall biosynthesis